MEFVPPEALEVELETEEEEEKVVDLGESFALTSLSSSLMVSRTLDVLCLMTLTNCGGATSVMNLAMRAFAIVKSFKKKLRRKRLDERLSKETQKGDGCFDFGCG